jgi:endonuclease/exonuclease/phosphatase family metal-dependent hydrolase
VRTLSYNIHGCIGRDGREDPDRIIDVIRRVDADIVGLQEVHHDDALDRDFLRKLEQLPYRSVIYGKTLRKATADYGNVLLLREPPQKIKRIELPNHSGEPRGAIIADTKIGGQALRVIATHLDIHSAERKQQMDAVLQFLPNRETGANCILLGDLNEWLPIRPHFRKFRAHFSVFSKLRTFPVTPSLFALDRIALNGKIQQYRFKVDHSDIAQNASDHRPLIGDIEWL